MSLIEQLLIVVCLVLATGKEAFGQMKPSNAVAEIGGEAILNCSGTLFLPNWFMSKDGTSANQLPIAGSCNVIANLQNHYKTEQTGGPNTCNLIVFNVTMEQAGVYWCSDAVPSYALLTVIESYPVATVNSTTTVVENESVVIACNLNYNGSVTPAPTLQPYFYWMDFNGQNVSSSFSSTTETTAVSQLTVTAGRENIMPYACHVYLQLISSTNPGYANNTPIVHNSASSTTIEVLYGPSIPVITIAHQILDIHGIACEVGVLTCSSSGNPPPTYQWFDTVENVIISNDGTFDLAESNWDYTCVAENTIRNYVYQDMSFHVYTSQTHEQDCNFPRNESTWITITGCDNTSTCVCSQGRGGLTLICHAMTYPSALYAWKGTDGSIIYSQVHEDISSNGTYYCTAYFDRTLSNYTGNVIFLNGRTEKTVTECSISITSSSTSATMESSTPASACDCDDVAIAMGVLFGISLAVDITILIIWLSSRFRAKQDPFKKPENVLPPEMMDLSKGTSEPLPYEELRRPDESQLHQTTYEELSPNYIAHDGQTIE